MKLWCLTCAVAVALVSTAALGPPAGGAPAPSAAPGNAGGGGKDAARPLPSDGPFVHPGLLNNRAELDFVKARVRAGDEPWASAYRQLRAFDNSKGEGRPKNRHLVMPELLSLDYRPRPVPAMVTDTDAFKKNETVTLMWQDMLAAYAHALVWYMEDDEAHARKAAEILNAWSYTLKSWTGVRKRYGGTSPFLGYCAAEILRATYPGWADADRAQYRSLLANVIWPFIVDGHPKSMTGAHFSNQESSVVMGKIAIAVYLDDRAKFADAVRHYERHLNNNIEPDGKNFETCRDMDHCQLSLAHLAQACEMAWKQGVDLYGLPGRTGRPNALLRSIDYQLPFLCDLPNKPDPGCKVDVRDPMEFYELAYNHYHNRKGLDCKLIEHMLGFKYEGVPYRPEPPTYNSCGIGTLTHHRLPRG